MADAGKLVLALETATLACSVALAEIGTASRIAEFTTDLRRNHSERLMPMVDAALRAAGAKAPEDIGAVAVSAGPGSFTGLRIGLATAKGLAFGWGTPLVTVGTLDALAAGAASALPGAGTGAISSPAAGGLLLCPILDAQKREVYAALYRANGEKLGGDWAVAPRALATRLAAFAAPVLFVGDGWWPYGDVFTRHLGPRAMTAASSQRMVASAMPVAALAARALAIDGHSDAVQRASSAASSSLVVPAVTVWPKPAAAVPRYVRRPEAEARRLAAARAATAPSTEEEKP